MRPVSTADCLSRRSPRSVSTSNTFLPGNMAERQSLRIWHWHARTAIGTRVPISRASIRIRVGQNDSSTLGHRTGVNTFNSLVQRFEDSHQSAEQRYASSVSTRPNVAMFEESCLARKGCRIPVLRLADLSSQRQADNTSSTSSRCGGQRDSGIFDGEVLKWSQT